MKETVCGENARVNTNTTKDGIAESNSNLLPLMESRTSLYAMLARLYQREVDQGLFDEMRKTMREEPEGAEDASLGEVMIARWLQEPSINPLTELAADYVRCFIGTGMNSHSAAYPFESVYTSPKRLLMQDARDGALAAYRSEGLGKAEEWKDCEDHIGVELEFMQILCERCAHAIEAGDEEETRRLLDVQRQFLGEHLMNWAPRLTHDMRRYAKTDFYRGLAQLTDDILKADEEFLGEMCSGED